MATPIADMVERMLSTGIPPEMIVLAIRTAEEASEKSIDPTAERRRAWDRERKRRKIPPIPPENSVPPPAYTTPPKEKPKKVSLSRGTRLASDWKPDAEDCAYAANLGLDCKAVLPDFLDYWHARAGPGAVKADWKATWRRWCRTASERSGGNGSLQLHPRRQPESPITAAANRIRQKLGLVEGRDDPGRVSQSRLPKPGSIHDTSGDELDEVPERGHRVRECANHGYSDTIKMAAKSR